MAMHTMWAHGTAFAPPEFPTQGLDNVDGVPYTDVVGLRRGFGASWLGQPGNSNWFHISIPTPALVDGAAARLNRVFVLFSTGQGLSTPGSGGPTVIEVQVWDGVNQLQVFANLQGFGDRRSTLDANNSFVLPASAVIRFGVGISVRVQFETIGEQRIDFAAAGAEFELQPVFLRAFPFLMLLRKKP